MSRTWMPVAALALLSFVSRQGSAQPNVHYDNVQNPYLFLLREPAIHEELRLTEPQRRALAEVNERFDGPLLALRTAPAEKASQQVTQIQTDTQQVVQDILDENQQRRLVEVLLRMRGAECLQIDNVAESLALNPDQRQAVGAAVAEAQRGIEQLQEQPDGGDAPELRMKEYARLRSSEHEQLLGVLTSQQKTRLRELLGAPFDKSQLGRVAFKAPEFAESSDWINSKPLRIADLKGEVIALHYWTFG